MRSAGLALLVLLAACKPPAPLPLVPPPPRPVASAAAPTPARRNNPLWILARDEDPLEKARLAEAVGAAELIAALDDADVADVALAALPFADDADVALGPLADRLAPGPDGGHPHTPGRAADGALRRRVLSAILAVAGRPRRQREPLDPEGVRRCGQAVLAIAADAAAPREERVLAVSAARALAEQGYVDPARIPSDLDPKTRYPRPP